MNSEKTANQPGNRNTQILDSISKSSISAIVSSINDVSHLLNNLHIYQQSMIDCLALLAKTSENPVQNTFPPYQSHTLPGVVSFQQILKANGEPNETIEELQEKALNQKRVIYRLIENDFALVNQVFHRLQKSDLYIEEFVHILNGKSNLSLQPQRSRNTPKRKKPDIKIDFKNK
jgi:hypothetical protein